MHEIKNEGKTVAIFHRIGEWKEGLDFLTEDKLYIQSSTWWYKKGKNLKAHKHILNERTVKLTQETVVVLKGKLQVELYNIQNKIFHTEILEEGDIGIILIGGHGYKVLEDNTRIVEVKNGPFYSIEKDKELL